MIRLRVLAHLAETDDLATETAQATGDDIADGADVRSPIRTSPRSTTTSACGDGLEPRGHRPDLGLDVAAGPQHGIAHEYRGAACRRLLVVRHDRGVAHHDRDPVERRAELLRGDLGEDRPGALAHVRRPGVDDDAAVDEEADRRIRQPGRRTGLEPDGDTATATRRRRRVPVDQLAQLDGWPPPSPRRLACRPG